MNVHILLEEYRKGGVGVIGVFSTRTGVDTFIERYDPGLDRLGDDMFSDEERIVHIIEMSVGED